MKTRERKRIIMHDNCVFHSMGWEKELKALVPAHWTSRDRYMGNELATLFLLLSFSLLFFSSSDVFLFISCLLSFFLLEQRKENVRRGL